MSWPIPDFFVIKKPKKIKYWVWGFVYLISLIIFYYVVSYLLKDNNGGYFIYFISFFSMTAIFGIALGVRLFFYENDLMRYSSWEKQRIETKNEWSEWATKRVAILACEVITPKIHLDKLLSSKNRKEQILIEENEVLSLNILTELATSSRYEQAFEWLLSLLKEKIEMITISNQLKIYCVVPNCMDKDLSKDLLSAWGKVGLTGKYQLELINDYFSIHDCIDSLLKFEHSPIALIITCEFSSSETEFISASILSNEYQAENLSIESIGYVQRSMLTSSETMSDDIKMMKEYGQLSSDITPPLWFNNISEKLQTIVLSTLCSINNNHDMNEINQINSVLGKTGILSEWAAFSLISNVTYSKTEPNIMISGSKDNYIVICIINK